MGVGVGGGGGGGGGRKEGSGLTRDSSPFRSEGCKYITALLYHITVN